MNSSSASSSYTALTRRTIYRGTTAALATALLVVTSIGRGADAPGTGSGSIEPDGTVIVPSFRLPPSIYMSAEASKALPRTPADPEEVMLRAVAAGQAGEMRKKLPQYMAGRIKHLVELFPVTMQQTSIAGVAAVIATPVKPIPSRNQRKIILNLPGGGFVMGEAGSTGMTESIPLAVLARVQVVSITYRQAPETTFPAVAVYRELLKTHRAQDIAIYGCSAGGLLAAESVAWNAKEKLPQPGALGILCAAADARWAGDSRAWGRSLQALPVRADSGRAYFRAEDIDNPLASPVLAPELLRLFPPTLIITATRAMEMSAAVNTHRELVKAGIDAELHVWDGLGHAFFYNIDLPESREAFEVMANFFQRHLKLEH
jgi:epsilon-lactone hydrolase